MKETHKIQKSYDEILVIYTNCDSVSNKIEELKALVSDSNPDIILLTEVKPKHSNSTLTAAELHLNGYNLYLNDLTHRHNRGLAVYTKKPHHGIMQRRL